MKENYQQELFHNTVNLEGEQLAKAEDSAKNQDEIILKFFEKNIGWFTPYQVWKAIFTERPPLTSIRRSITTLTKNGKLQKSEATVVKDGGFGVPSHGWKLSGE